MGLESNVTGDAKLYFGSASSAAEDFELGADSLRSLPHARQSPVPIQTRLQHLTVYSAAIVADKNPELTS